MTIKKVEREKLVDWLGDWTFKNRDAHDLTHKIHKYPAMFIPELVSKIIKTYSDEGDVVLDIFNGSGSTLVECIINKRTGIGIELNPLACMITNAKINFLPNSVLIDNKNYLLKTYADEDVSFELACFENIDFWFHQETIQSVSKLLFAINSIENSLVRNLFLVSFSEIVRNISFCNHNGFKMHRDKQKLDKAIYNKEKLWNTYETVLDRNIIYVSQSYEFSKNNNLSTNVCVHQHDTTRILPQIEEGSIDLIVTSPPYGDSRTTVAYGQFSRLSAQLLNIDGVGESKIGQLDNELLGGKTKHIDIENYKTLSITLENIIELFSLRYQIENSKEKKKKHLARLKDIVSFYQDLEKAIKNASYYLKNGKYFVLVTASRVVHGVKLHTDQIISEIGFHYGFKVKKIFYRDILNKRMPNKVSATNVVGETAPTMTEETILVLIKDKK